MSIWHTLAKGDFDATSLSMLLYKKGKWKIQRETLGRKHEENYVSRNRRRHRWLGLIRTVLPGCSGSHKAHTRIHSKVTSHQDEIAIDTHLFNNLDKIAYSNKLTFPGTLGCFKFCAIEKKSATDCPNEVWLVFLGSLSTLPAQSGEALESNEVNGTTSHSSIQHNELLQIHW